MSLQSMFNAMIGNIGVEASILKNRLRPEEEQKVKKPAEAKKTAKKGDAKAKTTNDTTKPVERRETAPEGPTEQIKKGGRPKGSQNLRVLERYQQRVMTIQDQQAGVRDRYNAIKSFHEKEMSR